MESEFIERTKKLLGLSHCKDINEDFVNDVLIFFLEKGIMEKPIKIQRWFNSAFGVRVEGDCFEKRYDTIMLPMELETDDYGVKYYMYHQMRYGFNYHSIMKKHNLSYDELVVIHSVLHEIGHIIHGDIQIKRYGYLKEVKESKFSEYREVDSIDCSKDNGRLMYKKYREISCEKIADKTACDLFKRFEKELIDIVKTNKIFI